MTIRSGVAQFANNSSGGTGTITLGDTSGNASATLRLGTATASNSIVVAAGGTGTLAIENVYNTHAVFAGPVTLNKHLLLTSQGGGAGNLTMSGGFTGTGNLTLNAIATGRGITLSTNAIDMVGTVTNSGAGTGINTISSVIGSNVTGVIQNSESSRLLLSGNSTYSGPTTVNAGVLQLNRATGSLSSSSDLTMGGGAFVFDNVGATTATSQALNTLTFNRGESTVRLTHTVAQNEVLAFTSLAARTAGATGTFSIANALATNSATNGFTLGNVPPGTFIDKGIFVTNPTSTSLTNYAWYDSTGYVRAINYNGDPNAGTSGPTTTLASRDHQRFTGPISAQGNATFKTLNVSAGNNMTLAPGSIVTVNGILKNAGSAAIISGVADLGAGWGFLTDAALQRCRKIEQISLFEADSRSLDCARTNLAGWSGSGENPAPLLSFHWHDVATGIPGTYDAILMNPPFHTGQATDIDLGRAFLSTAAAALRRGGKLCLVANRQLPYESMLDSLRLAWRKPAENPTYKLLFAEKR